MSETEQPAKPHPASPGGILGIVGIIFAALVTFWGHVSVGFMFPSVYAAIAGVLGAIALWVWCRKSPGLGKQIGIAVTVVLTVIYVVLHIPTVL